VPARFWVLDIICPLFDQRFHTYSGIARDPFGTKLRLAYERTKLTSPLLGGQLGCPYPYRVWVLVFLAPVSDLASALLPFLTLTISWNSGVLVKCSTTLAYASGLATNPVCQPHSHLPLYRRISESGSIPASLCCIPPPFRVPTVFRHMCQ